MNTPRTLVDQIRLAVPGAHRVGVAHQGDVCAITHLYRRNDEGDMANYYTDEPLTLAALLPVVELLAHHGDTTWITPQGGNRYIIDLVADWKLELA